MSRVNKYRGIHIHVHPQNERLNGTWIYGYLSDENYINSPELEGEYLVDKDTVGQYIGVNDKNGKEIYEGDIVKVIEDFEEIYVVEWDEDIARYVLVQNGATMFDFGDVYGDDMEVIGNVYENEDLLKGQAAMSEEKYAIEQIIETVMQAGEEIIQAIKHQDREMLEDVLKDYLH